MAHLSIACRAKVDLTIEAKANKMKTYSEALDLLEKKPKEREGSVEFYDFFETGMELCGQGDAARKQSDYKEAIKLYAKGILLINHCKCTRKNALELA